MLTEQIENWLKECMSIGYSPYDDSDMVAFAKFCLEKQSQQTGLKDANGGTINYGDTIESLDSEGRSIRHLKPRRERVIFHGFLKSV